MKRSLLAILLLAVAAAAPSCAVAPGVSSAELERIVRRDAVAFDPDALSPELAGFLSSRRALLIGEVHFLREHRELLVAFLRALHGRGFRQILIEWTQVADWLLDDFVLDGGLEPHWVPPEDIGGGMFAAVRDFNRSLPESERIRVRPVDATLADYGGAASFVKSLAALAKHLPDPGPLADFIGRVRAGTAEPEALLPALAAAVTARRDALVASWGAARYGIVAEMIEVEAQSAAVRAMRGKDYDASVLMREEIIQRLVERRLRDSPHRAIINVGATHAQKEGLWGTRIAWLGERLTRAPDPGIGPVLVICVAPARIVAASGGAIIDAGDSRAPENELCRVLVRCFPDSPVFLPLTDPVFRTGRVLARVGGEFRAGPLGRQFDAFILLPEAHRVAMH